MRYLESALGAGDDRGGALNADAGEVDDADPAGIDRRHDDDQEDEQAQETLNTLGGRSNRIGGQ
jgi:hypothetical protein